MLFLYTYCVYVIQSVSKILRQILDVTCRQQERRNILTNIFQQTQRKRCWKQSLHFYLWGNLKSLVYSAPFHQRISDACQTVSTRPGTLEIVRESMMRSFHPWIDPSGTHFNHFLWTVISQTFRNLQLLNFEYALKSII